MSTPAEQILSDFKGDHLSVHMADAVGDVRCVSDAAMTIGSPTMSSPSGRFTSSDVGKLVKVYGAGVGQFSPNLYGTITAFSTPKSVTVSVNAGRSVSGAKCLLGTDYTAQFQALLDVCNSLYIPFGGYGITGLTVLPGQRIYGQNKGGASGLLSPGESSGTGTDIAALGSCLVNFSDSAYAIEYLSDGTPAQIQDGLTFERLTIISKNGIRINDPTVAVGSQSYIHPVLCREVLFQGDYDFDEDPESFTATLPTATGSANSLDQYGVGFAGRKLLRNEIKDCTFYGYGMAVWMCDWSQSSVRHCRLVHCGLFIWSSITGVDANWNKIIDNEIIEFTRKGAIYIQYCGGLLIQGNWFEQNSAVDLSWLSHGNPTYIYSVDDNGLSIVDNIFLDNYSIVAPLYHLTTRLPGLITNNHYVSSGLTQPFAEIDVTYYVNTSYQTLDFIFGNDANFPVPDYPAVVPAITVNPYLMQYSNFSRLGGAVTVSFPWEISATTGDWVIKSSPAGFIWLPRIQSTAHRNFRMAVSARKIPATGNFNISIYYYSLVGNITGCTATNPIQITLAGHGLTTGDLVILEGVLVAGFSGTPANGQHVVTVTGANTFTLNGADGTGDDPYSTGGKVYLRTLYASYGTGISDTAKAETAYLEFGLPSTEEANGFWGIDTNNDRAEIESMQLFPFEDSSVLKGKDGQTTNLLTLRTHDDIDRLTVGIDGRENLPTFLDSVGFKTANYTVLPTDKYIGVSTFSGAVTLALPTLASTYNATRDLGQRYIIKWVQGPNTLTIDPNGSETIEGAATYVFGAVDDAIIIQNDGSTWRIVARYSLTEGFWRWSTVGTSIRTDYQVGINTAPGVGIQLDVNGVVRGGAFQDDGATSNIPARWDGSKQLVSGPVRLGNSADVDVTGLTAGEAASSDGSKLVSLPGMTGSVTLVTSVGGATNNFNLTGGGSAAAFTSITTTTITMNFTNGLWTS